MVNTQPFCECSSFFWQIAFFSFFGITKSRRGGTNEHERLITNEHYTAHDLFFFFKKRDWTALKVSIASAVLEFRKSDTPRTLVEMTFFFFLFFVLLFFCRLLREDGAALKIAIASSVSHFGKSDTPHTCDTLCECLFFFLLFADYSRSMRRR